MTVDSAIIHRTRQRWRTTVRSRVVLTVVSLLSGLLAVTVHEAAPALAAAGRLDQTVITTNNMQGAFTKDEDGKNVDSKWSSMVRGFIQTDDIVLLQEVGAGGPPGADSLANITRNGHTIQHYEWRVGTDRTAAQTGVARAQVYFLQTDSNGGTNVGGRVNIAIVTRTVPDDLMVVENPVNAGRAALGARFGDRWYFNLHGLSGGGNDSGALLQEIANRVAAYNPSHRWTAGGDFNRDPSTLTLPAGSRTLRTGLATHQSGGELDYFVTTDPTSPSSPPVRGDGLQSDHYAVHMGRMRAGADPPELRVMVNGDASAGRVAGLVRSGVDDLVADMSGRSDVFVGSNTSEDGTAVEGDSGEEISAVAGRDAKAVGQYKPNLVMLQAGTWDVQHGRQSGAPERLSALVDQIQAADPTAVVAVATLAPTADTAKQAAVTAFNASVEKMVATRVAAGERVAIARTSGMTTGDLNADGVTPNAAGQQKIANSFVGALLWAVVMGWVSQPNPATAPSGSVCDIYAYHGTPCVGAYSMTRALYADYDGPLYQVQRASDNATDNIGPIDRGTVVNADEQDSFCAGTSCTVSVIFDQSYQLNDLTVAPGGGANPAADRPADASALPITVGGHKAYGLDITPGTGYRNNNTRGVATGSRPEGMYMVASGTNYNNGCCFDFGNAEPSTLDTGNGHMDAVNFSSTCYFQPCSGNGPWVEADLENGLFSGANGSNTANTGINANFVTAMLKNNGTTTYALKGGNAQTGGLSTWWEGGLPDPAPSGTGYKPMQTEGAILLGIGGDNSNWSRGSFFEGVMTKGYPSTTADAAVQANIAAADYDGDSGGTHTVPSAAGPAVVHDGYSSVFTVDSGSGHLQETYLPKMGDPWHTQDLSAKYGTPPVLAGTQPVAVTHDGYTSVFTVDADTGDVRETYLPKTGDPWTTQDLTEKYGTPTTSWTPTAVVHDGYTSVYSENASNGHLQETYLPKMGDPWHTQDLSAKYGTPPVQPGAEPVALVHDGYTSVYTIDDNHHLQETYLPKMGDPWHTQDLSAKYGTPATNRTPTAVVHDGYASVYTVNEADDHLQETNLPKMGDAWWTQDLSAKYGTPPVAPGTLPTALTHTGFTSVYTVDRKSNHLQETYLPKIGDSWYTQDLSEKYGTATTVQTPIPLLHPDESGALTWTSVYTIDQFSDHLRETYLPKLGDPWVTQDLSEKYGTPPDAAVQFPTAGSSVVHDGYTSMFTIDATSRHLMETYLPKMGDPWSTQDVSAQSGTPPINYRAQPVALTHDGYTSVFTIDDHSHLWETYLPKMGDSWASQDLTAKYGAPQMTRPPAAVFHSGYVSLYSIDPVGLHLLETYLPKLGGPWYSQDLSAKYSAPVTYLGTNPVAVVHSGWVSVFTAAYNGHLQETYLPAIGDPWSTQDLTAKYGAPTTESSPAAVVHDGFTSVYTINDSYDDNDHDLQETYLPAIGGPWHTQDLSEKYGTPKVVVQYGGAPVALYHSGYTSVYTLNDSDNHLQETYLPAMGDPWTTQDLTVKYGTPPSRQNLDALVHPDTGGGLTSASLFTVNVSNGHLQETYLPKMGDPWSPQDLTEKYGAPIVK